jgi:hypothetical protein
LGTYVENESGAKLARPELFRLIADSTGLIVLGTRRVHRTARIVRLRCPSDVETPIATGWEAAGGRTCRIRQRGL